MAPGATADVTDGEIDLAPDDEAPDPGDEAPAVFEPLVPGDDTLATSGGGTSVTSPTCAPATSAHDEDPIIPDDEHPVTSDDDPASVSVDTFPPTDGTFTKNTFDKAYDELTPAHLLYLIERGPHTKSISGQLPRFACEFRLRRLRPGFGFGRGDRATKHQRLLHGTTLPETLGTQRSKVVAP